MKLSLRKLNRIAATFQKYRILVVGDVMLDQFLWGDVDRINPEAPVPVLRVSGETYAPGGAANAAANIVSLGGRAFLVSLIGNDEEGKILSSLLKKRKIQSRLVPCRRRTITKMRAIARGQQLLRIDYEEDPGHGRFLEKKLLDCLKKPLGQVDAVLISDYGKGVVTQKLVEKLMTLSDTVTVDPEPRHIDFYRNVSLITPNTKESCRAAQQELYPDVDIDAVGAELSTRLKTRVLVTRGKDGMSLYQKDREAMHLPTVAKEVVEVTGAGDTVIATLTLAVAAGMSLEEAVETANMAAGLVVSKVGTATITAAELLAAAKLVLRRP